ncbi:MAG: formate dehydrogenase accessory sulfurtransferase FdhD [Candidatus Melainabacteria bacterium]|nr:formate dehydrogenase accessory sulfurtransferase FdhD [Candidatus Melainabacteria bacterium]
MATILISDRLAKPNKRNVVAVRTLKVNAGVSEPSSDILAAEEPLEISVAGNVDGEDFSRTIAITMRTPGSDEELALGFLFCEGIISGTAEIDNVLVKDCNYVCLSLRAGVRVDQELFERHSFVNSSCGVCGKKSIDFVLSRLSPAAVQANSINSTPDSTPMRISGTLISKLPDCLRKRQDAFESTGGSHAAALFDFSGQLLAVQEDVGRHNALDKLIGSRLKLGKLPLRDTILLLSGRASFELIQKAACAEIPIVVSIGAPSSLAVELALNCGITLIGFVREKRFNVYAAEHRIHLE